MRPSTMTPLPWELEGPGSKIKSCMQERWTLLSAKIREVTLMRPIHGNL